MSNLIRFLNMTFQRQPNRRFSDDRGESDLDGPQGCREVEHIAPLALSCELKSNDLGRHDSKYDSDLGEDSCQELAGSDKGRL